MEPSILTSTKKILGIPAEDESFDLDVATHINSEFSILHQMGIGPTDGFVVEDDSAVWEDFIVDGDKVTTNLVRTCVFLRVRLLWDPPQMGFLVNALEEQLKEHEYRLSTQRELTDWIPGEEEPLNIIDGGGA